MMEESAYEFNLTRSAEIICSKTRFSISEARELLRAGVYFELGDLDAIENLIIQKELSKI